MERSHCQSDAQPLTLGGNFTSVFNQAPTFRWTSPIYEFMRMPESSQSFKLDARQLRLLFSTALAARTLRSVWVVKRMPPTDVAQRSPAATWQIGHGTEDSCFSVSCLTFMDEIPLRDARFFAPRQSPRSVALCSRGPFPWRSHLASRYGRVHPFGWMNGLLQYFCEYSKLAKKLLR